MKKIPLLVLAFVFAMAGSAMADAFNVRPTDFGPGYSGESTMQDILDTVLGTGTLDDYDDQNAAAIWQLSEADVSTYRVVSITSVPGSLGIYSFTDNTKTALLDFDSDSGSASFGIDVSGTLFGDLIGGSVAGFGQSFGFFWQTGGGTFYTEDSRNSGTARSLSYLVANGTTVDLTDANLEGLTGTIQFVGGWNNTITALSNNDWILGFEDGTDGDFQDSVFYVEDMVPIPEPGTMLLIGSGLLGLGVATRLRKKR